MANRWRFPWKNASVFQDLPTSGDGSAEGDPIIVNGGLVGINLWGTGAGQGIPAGSDFGMIALDGTPVVPVTLASAVTEGSPIYIDDSDNSLTDTATDNTLYGYADEESASGSVTIGVRIKAQVNV